MAFEVKESEIKGLYIIYPHYYADERGSNMKTFHKDTFETVSYTHLTLPTKLEV